MSNTLLAHQPRMSRQVDQCIKQNRSCWQVDAPRCFKLATCCCFSLDIDTHGTNIYRFHQTCSNACPPLPGTHGHTLKLRVERSAQRSCELYTLNWSAKVRTTMTLGQLAHFFQSKFQYDKLSNQVDSAWFSVTSPPRKLTSTLQLFEVLQG